MFAPDILYVVSLKEHANLHLLPMALVRRLQRKKNVRYLAIPRVFCDQMSLHAGQYFLIHVVNDRQLVLTKVAEDVPVIEVEKEGG